MRHQPKIFPIAIVFIIALRVFAADISLQEWTVLTSAVDTNLRGLSVKCEKNKACVIWASGSNGIVLRSCDDGKTWKQLTVPDAHDYLNAVAFSGGRAWGAGPKGTIAVMQQ